jgi:hypothetical protein
MKPRIVTNDCFRIENVEILAISSNFSPKSAINLMHAIRVCTEQPQVPEGILRWAYDVIEGKTEAAQ